jgi:hypothetical protein
VSAASRIHARERSGMRRVDWVRLHVDGTSVTAEAVGVGYRLPRTAPIPVAVAAALIAEGTPCVTCTAPALSA